MYLLEQDQTTYFGGFEIFSKNPEINQI